MIRLKGVLHIIGLFLIVLGAAMLAPLIYGLAAGSGGVRELGLAAAATLAAGAILFLALPRPATELNVREAALLVSLVWFAVGLFGGLPYWFSPYFPHLTDAFFESASGFTTTGATVLATVEVLPPALQLWRHFSHWLGGMGIVLLGLAVLPLLGTGGLALYRAEFSGAKSEKLKPRIAETALSLWRIYLALTFAQYVLLRVAGMSGFEAICHAFSTLGTGGFSTRNASIGGFNSPLIEWIIIVFMILAGVNFALQYRLWVERNPRRFFLDAEVRWYAALLVTASLVITVILLRDAQAANLHDSFRTALFQVTSILTTTGFATANFELWAPAAQFLLLGLMFIGGCTGSTAGGLKVARVLLLSRVVEREFKRMVERRAVFAIRLGREVIPENTIQALLNLVYLTFLFNGAACFVVAAAGVDPFTSITAVTACMFSIGPGLGHVGPAEHYGHLPALAKWTLSVCMVAGRLEFYTLLVIFTRAFWRK
ncbi:MAG: potassium transporter [Bryobacteraceae bacterium]|nr:potassium transporter [Bryobacteraceae bacterium]